LARLRRLLVLCLLLAAVRAAGAQSPSPTGGTSPSPGPSATPIPLSRVVTDSEEASRDLQIIAQDAVADPTTTAIESALPGLSAEIAQEAVHSRSQVDNNPSLDTLRSLEADWAALGDPLPGWSTTLTARATQLDHDIQQLADLRAVWSHTLDAASPSETPPEVIARIRALLAAVEQARASVETRRARVLALQDRVAELSSKIDDSLKLLHSVRSEAMTLLFVQDSPVLWQASIPPGDSLASDVAGVLEAQVAVLHAYAIREQGRFLLHGLIILFLLGFLMWVRDRIQPLAQDDPALGTVFAVFRLPFASALALSLIVAPTLYPRAPRLLDAIMAGVVIVPSILILRQVVERSLYPVVHTLVVFYLADVARYLLIGVPVVYRGLFLVEMSCGLGFIAWLLQRAKSRVDEEHHVWHTVLLVGRAYAVAFSIALIANILGYVGLARLVGNAALDSGYGALILYGAVRIIEGLAIFALQVRPLVLLGAVSRHEQMLRTRIQRVLAWIGAIVWSVSTLELFSIRAPLFDWISGVFSAQGSIGSIHISALDVIEFAFTVWAAFMVSRFIRFILEEDVYSRVPLARGVPYAISTLLHYVVLVVGFVFAVASLGMDMSRFTILAGAFGVGIGFGLQNIVNNFVSGLILLFERPVKVGDSIELESHSGSLRQIGLRASILRTWDGSEVIVPNGTLISQEVVNWTLSDQTKRIEIDIGLEYGCDPEQVVELLTRVAAAHPEVLPAPAAQCLFMGFGDSALNFQIRAWTANFDRWLVVRSELNLAIVKAVRAAGIEIPFPQRDLHIRSLSPEAARSIAPERGA
jgi:small-conductance mechanosensitive channel